MPIDSENLSRLLEFLHRLDAKTIREVISVAETVLTEKEGRPANTADKPSWKETGESFTDESHMPFGKFRGKPLGQVDEQYLRWLWKQRPIKASPSLEAYIQKRFYPNETANQKKVPF